MDYPRAAIVAFLNEYPALEESVVEPVVIIRLDMLLAARLLRRQRRVIFNTACLVGAEDAVRCAAITPGELAALVDELYEILNKRGLKEAL